MRQLIAWNGRIHDSIHALVSALLEKRLTRELNMIEELKQKYEDLAARKITPPDAGKGPRARRGVAEVSLTRKLNAANSPE